MKANVYTPEVAAQIKRLLKERSKVPADKQKGIRAKIRSLGFKISDYWTGFTDIDFDNEIKSGRITISSHANSTSKLAHPKESNSTINKKNHSMDFNSIKSQSQKKRVFI